MTPPRNGPAGADTRILTPPVRRALVLLFVLGTITHAIGLAYPRQVVFDEVHWGKSVTAYCCTGQRVFDVHPPHGKLLLTIGAKLAGYKGDLPFQAIGESYGDTRLFLFRSIPALAGIAIPLLFLLLLRCLGASAPTAFLGGLLVALDNAMLLETHVLLFDGLLVAAILASLVLLLAADRSVSRTRVLLLMAGSGAMAGLAAGIKFTGLVSIALISIYLAVRVLSSRGEFTRRLQQWLVIAAAAGLVYLGGWAIHFAVLPNPGPADAFHPTTGHFIEDLKVVHRTMLAANVNLAQQHPDASSPLSWPWMRVPPYFWTGSGATIYLVGNPVVWWGASLLFIVVLVNQMLMKVTRLRIDGGVSRALMLWLPIVGYAIAFLPFFGIKRVLFLYHYFTPLLFSLAVVLLWLERAGWIRAEGTGRQRPSYYGVIAAAIVAFLLLSPLTYGYSLGNYDEWLVRIVRSWR